MSEEFKYPEVLPLVEKICECAEKEGMIPGAYFKRLLSSFASSDTYNGNSDVLYHNKHFDIKECRANKLLEFESAIRYLGLPVSISRVGFDFVEREAMKDKPFCAIPIGLDYAIYADRNGISVEQFRKFMIDQLKRYSNVLDNTWDEPLVKLEFVVAMTKEVRDYLPDMENRYYAYKDGEDSGWRL